MCWPLALVVSGLVRISLPVRQASQLSTTTTEVINASVVEVKRHHLVHLSPTDANHKAFKPQVLDQRFWKEDTETGERRCTQDGEKYLKGFSIWPDDTSIRIRRETRGLWSVFLWPADDDRGSFKYNANLCYRLLGLLSAFPNLLWHPNVNSADDAREKLLVQDQEKNDFIRDGELVHLVLGGHGEKTHLRWGKGTRGILETPPTYNEGIESFFKVVEKKLKVPSEDDKAEGRVVIDSCSTAQDPENGFAKYVADRLQGHRVYASKISYRSVGMRWESSTVLAIRSYPNFAMLIRGPNEITPFDDMVTNYVWVGNCEPLMANWKTKEPQKKEGMMSVETSGGFTCQQVADRGGCLESWRAQEPENHDLFDPNNFMNNGNKPGFQYAHEVCCQCGGGRTRETTQNPGAEP